MADREALLKILDLARWAPSGDNTQPWRFEIVAEDAIAVHGFDTRDEVLYDFDGHASHMAHGALLETLRIAATGFGLRADWSLRPGSGDRSPIYDVRLTSDPDVRPDPLMPSIETRVVQRRPMQTTALDEAQRAALVASVGSGYRLSLLESGRDRLRIARLLWANAGIRLTCPEAYRVHKAVIEWNARFSKDRIPEQAVGVDPLTARLMHWVMQSWERVEFFNRFLAGTIAPRVQLDLTPGLACAAHMLLSATDAPSGVEDYVRAGVAMQRLWLTAASVGLHLQPEMTPVIFSWYARAGRSVSARPDIDRRVASLAERFERLFGAEESARAVFLCRVGRSKAPTARSLRRDLGDLMFRP